MRSHQPSPLIFADRERLGRPGPSPSCGWARTIRDMKTFGFVELNDGSCFKNLQVVLDADALDNYKEIAGQNVGAALIVTGTVVLTPEAKQPLEVKAASIAGGGRLHAGLSPPEEAPQRGVPAHHPAPAAPDQPVLRRLPGAQRGGPRHPHASSRTGASSTSTPPSSPPPTARAPGEMFRVTTLDVDEPAPDRRTAAWTTARTSSASSANLTVSGQLNAENFAMAFGRRVHLRPHLPGGELQHPAPRRRVLDDRAGDGLLPT